MRTVSWESLLGALVKVERIGSTDSGMISFGASPGGGIFVEKGRICWVAAVGLQNRLRHLLRLRTPGREADVDRIYERCRAEGRPFGQTLVAEKIVASAELEAALRRHSAESLAHLCAQNGPRRWSSRGGRGYSPDFTFRAVDVLFDVVDLVLPEARQAARAAVDRFGGNRHRAAAFYVDDQSELPVPIFSSRDGSDVESLLAIGRWATTVAAASTELATSPSFTLATAATGETLFVWWRNSFLYTVACEDRASVAAATAQHLAGS